jgi:hypothetical protein
MANPTKIEIDRTFSISLTPAVAANLPVIRGIESARNGYGMPAGTTLYEIRDGDVITDPTIIAAILNSGPAWTSTLPQGAPLWANSQ